MYLHPCFAVCPCGPRFYLACMVSFLATDDLFAISRRAERLSDRANAVRAVTLFVALALSAVTIVIHVLQHACEPHFSTFAVMRQAFTIIKYEVQLQCAIS